MAMTPAAGAEPIPGYRLIEKIGIGGYGEVWKVTAPGGLNKAMKVLYGDLTGPRAEQELKALERIKSVRHPFLLSLERFEVVDGQLLIVTELADRSLQERFTECKEAGLAGIPRDELLTYVGDAAEALDYMNETHGLQHLDIKPQNLLLTGGRVKVADFGLVKDLLGTSASITGGVTPVYAPPEAFDGRASRASDQYSLAIVYQEMLTSQRPFPGTTAFQLAAQHTSAPPLLDPLPLQDRRIIGKALSKLPEQRFKSCRDLVEGLRKAAAPPPPRPGYAADAPGSPGPPGVPSLSDFPLDRGRLLDLDTVVRLAPDATAPSVTTVTGEAPAAPRAPARGAPPAGEVAFTGLPAGAPGGLRPTLFVGVGDLAGTALRLLRRRLHRHFGGFSQGAPLPIVQFLLLDTDRASLRQAQQGPPGEALAGDEVVHCPLFPPEHYRDRSKALLRWLPRPLLYGIPRSLQTEGLRPLGRLALVDHGAYLLAGVRQALRRMTDPASLAAAVGVTGRALRTESPRVFVLASLTGGASGGMLVDVAYAVRQVLAELEQPDDGISGVLVYAGGPRPDDRARAKINAYATLLELHHWAASCENAPGHPGAPEQGLLPSPAGVPPFADCYLLHPPQETGAEGRAAVADLLAEYLAFDVVLGGGLLDRLRLGSRAGVPGMALRSFGLWRVGFPREQLVELASQAVCRHLAERWTGEVTPQDRERIEHGAKQLVAEQRLNEEKVRERFYDGVAALMGEEPETAFDRIAALAGGAVAPPGSPVAARQLDRIDALLGAGSGADPGTTPSLVGQGAGAARAEAAYLDRARQLGREMGRAVVEWVLEKVEVPGVRLRGAECGLSAVSEHLLAEADKARARMGELRLYRQHVRRKLLGKEGPGKGSEPRWRGPWRLRAQPPAVAQLLWSYFWIRVEELTQESTLAVLGGVQARSAALGQELALSRQRLGELVGAFPAGRAPADASPSGPALRNLFPFGAENLAGALSALLGRVPPEMVRQLDAMFQGEVLDPGGGLWAMLCGNVDVTRLTMSRSPASLAFWNLVSRNEGVAQGLRDALMTRARGLVSALLKGVDAASLFLEWHGGPERAAEALAAEARAAAPLAPVPARWQHVVLAVPEGPAGATLRDLALEVFVGTPLTLIEAGPSLLIAREAAQLSLAEVAAQLVREDPTVAELAQKVLTRTDVVFRPLGGDG